MEVWIVSLISYVIPLVLHSIGIVLLLTKSSNVSRSQTILMINLSLSAICLSATSAAHAVLEYYYAHQNIMYQHFVICSMVSCLPYYAVMYILTLDRLAEVYLNIRYPLYWSARKTKYCMIILWSITLCLLFSLFAYIRIERLNGLTKVEDFSYAYGFPFGDLLFLAIAFVTYIYIIRKIRQKKKITARISISTENTAVQRENCRKSPHQKKETSLHLLLPFMLVTTFVIFMQIPDLIYFLVRINVIANSDALTITLDIIYSIGYSSDAFIYVLLSTSFRSYIHKKCRRLFTR